MSVQAPVRKAADTTWTDPADRPVARAAQERLEHIVHVAGAKCDLLIKELLKDGADPFAFPKYALARSFSPLVNLGALSCTGLKPDSNPAQLSVMGHIFSSDSSGVAHCIEKIFSGLTIDHPIIIVRETGDYLQSGLGEMNTVGAMSERSPLRTLSLLDLMGSEPFIDQFSHHNGIFGIFTYKQVLEAHRLDCPGIKESLSNMAGCAIASSVNLLKSIDHKKFSIDAYETLGFKIFASLLLNGIDVPCARIPAQFNELGGQAPFLSSALRVTRSRVFKSANQNALMLNLPGMYTKVAGKLCESEGNPLMQRFIELGVSVNEQSLDTGQTTLMHAVKYGDLSAMRILIEAGADVSLKDNRGWTAASFAGGSGSESKSQIKGLLQAGAARQAIDKLLNTPSLSMH